MPIGPHLSREEQDALTRRLRDWIRQERDRGIPLENILISCGECGLIAHVDDDESDEPNLTVAD